MLSAIGTADPLKLDAREIFGQLPASRVGDAERRYVDELYEAGFGTFESADMPGRLESTFAEKFGVGYGISMNSGSGTLLSCLIAAGVGPGDEVICPVYGMPAGAFATVHAASFSFQGSKHMTSGGDGGIVITDDEAYGTRIRKAALHGYRSLTARPGSTMIPRDERQDWSYQRYDSLGYNFRMSAPLPTGSA